MLAGPRSRVDGGTVVFDAEHLAAAKAFATERSESFDDVRGLLTELFFGAGDDLVHTLTGHSLDTIRKYRTRFLPEPSEPSTDVGGLGMDELTLASASASQVVDDPMLLDEQPEPDWVAGLRNPRVRVLVGSVEQQQADVAVTAATDGTLAVGEAEAAGDDDTVLVALPDAVKAGQEDPAGLYHAYVAALTEADSLGATTVALPLLGVGSHGWTVRESVQQAFAALTGQPLEHIDDVLLVVADEPTRESVHRAFSTATTGHPVTGTQPVEPAELPVTAATLVDPEPWQEYLRRAGELVDADPSLLHGGDPPALVKTQVAAVLAVLAEAETALRDALKSATTGIARQQYDAGLRRLRESTVAATVDLETATIMV
jgi:hypothetical protein